MRAYMRRLDRRLAKGKISREEYIRQLKAIERSTRFAVEFMESPFWQVLLVAILFLIPVVLVVFR